MLRPGEIAEAIADEPETNIDPPVGHPDPEGAAVRPGQPRMGAQHRVERQVVVRQQVHMAPPEDVWAPGEEPLLSGEAALLGGRSVLILIARPAREGED